MLALVREYQKDTNNLVGKIKGFCKRIFCYIREYQDNEIYLYEIPPIEKAIKVKRIVAKLEKKWKKKEIKNVILSEHLGNTKQIKNEIYATGTNILNGRYIFKFLIPETLDYVAGKLEMDLKQESVAILVNDASETNIEMIKIVARNTRRVSIITNNINRFKKLEDMLYETEGIMITLANNKRKSLAKAKLILNIDFPEELLNKYTINKEATIINIENESKIKTKAFKGVCINYIKIKLNPEMEIRYSNYHDFDITILYEGQIYKKASISQTLQKIHKDNIKIGKIYGINGILDDDQWDVIKKSH